jgi:hypothetical protein
MGAWPAAIPMFGANGDPTAPFGKSMLARTYARSNDGVSNR